VNSEILEIVGLFLMASTKFLFAPSTAVGFGYSYWETILITITGGWFGVLVFFFFGRVVVDLFMRKYFSKKKTEKPKFTKTNKLIIKVKSNFGIIGLALITPVTISVPVGSILAARYFGENKTAIYILMGSIVFWSFVLTSISFQFKQLM
jgi:membrane protein DedA with SNARE-associated domain